MRTDLAGLGSAAVSAPTVLSVHDEGAELVERVAAALLAGGAVVLPTDTVYGLAALPGLRSATDQLFTLKGRAIATPLAVLCGEVEQALDLAELDDERAVRAVAEQWWPGPLTLVLPRRIGVPLYLGEPEDTIGLRVPDHDLVQAVARAVGPIAATSANRHGEPTATTAQEAVDALGPGVALVVDGGPLPATASTVIDALTRDWRVLREGPLGGAEVVARAAGATR
jgi:tRNA threonylcarbamoyl adenosine modification protein (Sua5/YciO/YrdC/YwlC family)